MMFLMSFTNCIKVNFPFHLLEKLMDLRNEYLQADEANKRFWNRGMVRG